jgi:DNA-binding NtrC family response regulator
VEKILKAVHIQPMVPVATIMSFVCISSGDPTSGGLIHLLDGVDAVVASPEEALERLKGARFDAVTIHLPLEHWGAEELLEQIHRTQASVPVILCDPEGTLADAVRFTKLGAFYFTKAEDPNEFKQVLQWASESSQSRDLANLGSAVSSEPWRKFLVGESRAMQQVMQVIRLVGKRRSTVLISGETGAGKEMVARAIHLASDRGNLPMVAVNCSALPENLLEAELFGHVKGAFTGAINHRVGRFEQAHRSTLFLDEVGDLPLDIQAKLLRVLQEREFQRIGSSETVKVDVRVIAASNIDLEQAVRDGKFREDLYYRLNVVPLRVPALRDRPSDIPILVHHLIDKICSQEGLEPRRLARETLDRLSRYSWPGNVRQLENAVEMAIALSGDRDTLYPADFPLPASPRVESRATAGWPAIALPDEGLDLTQIVANMERTILEQALRKTGGNKAQAAGMLRLKRTTLSAKLRSLSAARIA